MLVRCAGGYDGCVCEAKTRDFCICVRVSYSYIPVDDDDEDDSDIDDDDVDDARRICTQVVYAGGFFRAVRVNVTRAGQPNYTDKSRITHGRAFAKGLDDIGMPERRIETPWTIKSSRSARTDVRTGTVGKLGRGRARTEVNGRGEGLPSERERNDVDYVWTAIERGGGGIRVRSLLCAGGARSGDRQDGRRGGCAKPGTKERTSDPAFFLFSLIEILCLSIFLFSMTKCTLTFEPAYNDIQNHPFSQCYLHIFQYSLTFHVCEFFSPNHRNSLEIKDWRCRSLGGGLPTTMEPMSKSMDEDSACLGIVSRIPNIKISEISSHKLVRKYLLDARPTISSYYFSLINQIRERQENPPPYLLPKLDD